MCEDFVRVGACLKIWVPRFCSQRLRALTFRAHVERQQSTATVREPADWIGAKEGLLASSRGCVRKSSKGCN